MAPDPLAPRISYTGEGVDAGGLADNPYAVAGDWIDAAIARSAERGDVPEPTAMAVATVDASGRPDVRTVLMRFFAPEGPGFVTSLDSAKGRQLATNRAVAATLTWPSLFRAIRFRGRAEQLPADLIHDYFVIRPWGSRISAWASEQSAPVGSRAELEARVAELAARWPDTGSPDDVPVPPRWGGYRIVPDEVEFWAGRPDRLHDRIVYARVDAGTMADPAAWAISRRQP